MYFYFHYFLNDLVLVCSHDPGINKTTNVKELSYFKQKITSYNIDGEQLTDWFIIDFTLEELMKLRKVFFNCNKDFIKFI